MQLNQRVFGNKKNRKYNLYFMFMNNDLIDKCY